jgi:hypothetical protein
MRASPAAPAPRGRAATTSPERRLTHLQQQCARDRPCHPGSRSTAALRSQEQRDLSKTCCSAARSPQQQLPVASLERRTRLHQRYSPPPVDRSHCRRQQSLIQQLATCLLTDKFQVEHRRCKRSDASLAGTTTRRLCSSKRAGRPAKKAHRGRPAESDARKRLPRKSARLRSARAERPSEFGAERPSSPT